MIYISLCYHCSQYIGSTFKTLRKLHNNCGVKHRIACDPKFAAKHKENRKRSALKWDFHHRHKEADLAWMYLTPAELEKLMSEGPGAPK